VSQIYAYLKIKIAAKNKGNRERREKGFFFLFFNVGHLVLAI
jgi:hypothetical protein